MFHIKDRDRSEYSARKRHLLIIGGKTEKRDISNILLADDKEDHLAITKEFLSKKRSEFKLSTARSAEEALHKLKEKEFDAFISDDQRPDMDGL